MHFNSTSLIFVLLGSVSSCLAMQTTDFDPITSPGKGDVVHQGSKYTIKWSYKSDINSGKQVSLELEQGDSEASAKTIDTIAKNVTANDKEYKWNVGSGADIGDEYYIKISYSDDPSIFAYSNKFKLGAVESSSTKDSSSTVASPTGFPTSSAPATTSNAASLPTQFAAAPVAMVGAAAVGIFAF